jgi:hypothetical protein
MAFAVIAAIGDTAMAVSLCVCAMALPSQLLAMNSSRQFSGLPELRRVSLQLIFLFCMMLPSGLIFVLWYFDKPADYVSVFLTASILLSGYMTIGVLIASYIPAGQNLVAIFIFFFVKLANFLFILHLVACLSLLIIIWLSFAIWWLRWRPQRYLPNAMLLTQSNLRGWQQQIARSGAMKGWRKWAALGFPDINLQGSTPRTLVGSILLGYSDGCLWRSLVVTLAIYLIVATVCFYSDSFLNLLPFAFVAIHFFYIMTAWSILLVFGRNIKAAWLMCMGDRQALFNAIEQTYARASLSMIGGIAILHFLSCMIASEYLSSWPLAILLFVYSLVMIIPMLYLVLILYARVGMDLGVYTLVGAPLILASYAMLFVVMHYWPEQPLVAAQIVFGYAAVLSGERSIVA